MDTFLGARSYHLAHMDREGKSLSWWPFPHQLETQGCCCYCCYWWWWWYKGKRKWTAKKTFVTFISREKPALNSDILIYVLPKWALSLVTFKGTKGCIGISLHHTWLQGFLRNHRSPQQYPLDFRSSHDLCNFSYMRVASGFPEHKLSLKEMSVFYFLYHSFPVFS